MAAGVVIRFSFAQIYEIAEGTSHLIFEKK